jgi:type VI protein secretion system component VasF
MKIWGFKGKTAEERGTEEAAGEPLDAELRQALGDFRLAVHAWSEAALSRPRPALARRHRPAWRLAAAWTCSAILVAAGVSGGGFYQHRQEQIKQVAAAQARQAEQQRVVAVRRVQAREEEDLLAKVDSDVSREVPVAMEPLARLMDEGE